MKDIVTPVPQEDVKAVIRRCLEQAALVNYQRLSEYAKLEGKCCSISAALCGCYCKHTVWAFCPGAAPNLTALG